MKSIFNLFLFFLLLSCNKNSTGNSSSLKTVQYNIVQVKGDTSCVASQIVPLTVYYPFQSSCEIVDTFQQNRQGNIIFIKAFGTIDTNAICSMIAGIRTKVFNFSIATVGNYELRFLSKDSTYISHPMVVN